MTGNQPDASIGLCPCCKTTLEDYDHVLRCHAQKRTRYPALNDIRGTIAETRPPASPFLWQGFNHLLSNTSEPLSIDNSRYSGRTQLLVQQALDGQERIGWDKAFRGYLSLTWGHSNPTRGWVISKITKLGTFSKAMWTDRNQKLHDPTNTSAHPILMWTLSRTMRIIKIYSQLTVSFFTVLSRRSSVLDERQKMDPQHTLCLSTPTYRSHQSPLPRPISSSFRSY
jgi:hypothetical protein